MPVEVISEKDPLVGYQIVAVPAMYVLSQETAANLARFADAGGVVIFTPRTGVKGQVNAVVETKLPGLVAEMCGVEVEEYVSMPIDEDGRIALDLPDSKGEFTAAVWADVLKPITAAAVARYTRDYYADEAAITINTWGGGQVIYLGTMGDAEFYAAIAGWALALAGIESFQFTRWQQTSGRKRNPPPSSPVSVLCLRRSGSRRHRG